MARYRKSRKQAKPQEFIVTLGLVGFLLFAVTSQTLPVNILLQIIIFFVCIILIVLIGYYYLVYQKLVARRRALHQLQIDDVDTMSGKAFEEYVAELFRRLGYRIQDTPSTGDYGVDLIIYKDGIRSTVQAKRYSKPVNQAAVREAVAGMMHYKCTRSIVVTNNYFTKFAIELAKSNNCTLIDRDGLIKMIANSNPIQ